MNYSCKVTVQQYSLVIKPCVWGVGGETAVIFVCIDIQHAPLHSDNTSLGVKYSQYI